ncbi:p24 family protein delta-1 [Nematocida minor]|uniref:p24 family protein delta-1 n=1 Tax=Nematocida minor TaxID=1912983 RepID=UPI0022210EE4|nr:p24 family protein delta-1 [Nematocida minor]KAI5188969.1 p24 family protein delta-1 [Nematocida minor]
MKVISIILLVLGLAHARMMLNIKDISKPYMMQRGVINNQICRGVFKLQTPTAGSLSATIFSEDMRRVFTKEDIKHGEEVNFSFNTTSGQTYTVKIEEMSPIPEKSVRVEYEFTSQYNTFNKDIAKYEVIDPALSEMTKFEKLLYELSLQTSYRQRETAAFSGSINEIVISILCINLIMFIAFAGILAYQTISFKDFLKKKKLI